jgi:hypothetical protein
VRAFSEAFERAWSAAIAQLVEHVIRNDGVTGSSPVCGTILLLRESIFQDCRFFVPQGGAEMKTFARFVLVGAMLLARCAWAAESSPVAFAKSVVSEHGSQTFATVSYPDRSLIVEFRIEPYSTGKATAVRAFGEITKKIAQGAFGKFPKIKSVQLIGNLALRDKHGHDTVDRAMMVKFSKVNAATINWENVDPANVVEIADKQWILPGLGVDKK